MEETAEKFVEEVLIESEKHFELELLVSSLHKEVESSGMNQIPDKPMPDINRLMELKKHFCKPFKPLSPLFSTHYRQVRALMDYEHELKKVRKNLLRLEFISKIRFTAQEAVAGRNRRENSFFPEIRRSGSAKPSSRAAATYVVAHAVAGGVQHGSRLSVVLRS